MLPSRSSSIVACFSCALTLFISMVPSRQRLSDDSNVNQTTGKPFTGGSHARALFGLCSYNVSQNKGWFVRVPRIRCTKPFQKRLGPSKLTWKSVPMWLCETTLTPQNQTFHFSYSSATYNICSPGANNCNQSPDQPCIKRVTLRVQGPEFETRPSAFYFCEN